jgi:hypothetical protein
MSRSGVRKAHAEPKVQLGSWDRGPKITNY